jgi:predicted phage terminase large subunit-like protein
MTITPQEAAQELLKRRKARASLLDYARYIDVPGKPVSDKEDEWLFSPVETGLAAHHALMLSAIERVIAGELPRLMIFMPPGGAKSTYGSVVAPTWFMGRQPGAKIILTSYGSELAKKHGRKARQICKSPKYQALFGTSISKETSAADFWSLDNQSEYMSGGILSGITGNRAHGLIIDDPIKGRRDADSETVQQATWEAYQDDLRTRLVPGGWEIIIQTRWSENDISSKILPENYDGETGLIRCRDGRDWYVICIPAQHQADFPADPLGRQPGEYLWPEWFTEEHFQGFKAIPRTWNSLFQQRPTADEGDFFQRLWFRRFRVGGHPERLHVYMSSDHAPAGSDDGDFNCFRVWGVDPQFQVWLLDGFRTQETMDTATDKALALIKKWRPFAWFPEDDNNWKSVAGFVKREMIRQRIHCRIEPISPHGSDKPTKAQAFQGMAAMGMVYIPEGPDGDSVINQYIKFPAGKHDDEVDAAAIIGRAIDMAHPAIAEKPNEPGLTIAQEDWAKVLQKPKGKAKLMQEVAW